MKKITFFALLIASVISANAQSKYKVYHGLFGVYQSGVDNNRQDCAQRVVHPDWFFNGQSISPSRVYFDDNTGIISLTDESGNGCAPWLSFACDISKLPFGILCLRTAGSGYSCSQPSFSFPSGAITSSNLTNINACIYIGITPPPPDRIDINGTDDFVVEGCKIKISTPTLSTIDYSSEIDYSLDNTNWISITNYNAFVIPINPNTASPYIYFRSRVKRIKYGVNNVQLTSVSYSNYCTRRVAYRFFPNYTPNPGSILCKGGTTTISFTFGDFSNSNDRVSIEYNGSLSPRISPNSTYLIPGIPKGLSSFTIFYLVPKGSDWFIYSTKQYSHNFIDGNIEKPTITSNPSSVTVCESDNASFTVGASGTKPTYTWYKGSSTVGSNSDTLNLTNVKSSNAGQYTVEVRNDCGWPTSNSATLTVNPLPTPTLSASSTTICTGDNVTFTAGQGTGPAITTYNFMVNGVSKQSGTNVKYSTTILANNDVVTVEASTTNNCKATSAQIKITVNAIPTISSTTSGSRCGTGTVSLGATASAGTINWYAAATGGSSLGTGTSFTTPSISSTTTYYVAATSNGCTTASRSSVTATVAAITGVTNGSRCGTGTIPLGAAASVGTINWYAAVTGGSSLGTGSSFTTPSIGSTTTYYVDVTYNGCTTSPRIPVTATVKTIPSITGIPDSCCGNGIVTLRATATAGTISWYGTPIGGSALCTGGSFITPILTSTKTYYVETIDNGCTSSRSAVVATVNPLPIPSLSGPTIACANSEGNLYTTESGMPDYSWDVQGGTITSGGTSTSDKVTVTWSNLETGYVNVTYTDSKGCSSSSSTELSVTLSNPYLGSPGITPVNCFGENTGAIVIAANGGIAPYTYALKQGDNTLIPSKDIGDFKGLYAAPDYRVIVTDKYLCSFSSDDIFIDQPTSALSATATKVDVTCYDAKNGRITVNASGGTAPYRFSKDNGLTLTTPTNTPYTFTDLTPETYQVYIKDKNDCEYTIPSTFVVTQPLSALNATATKVDVTCYNGSNGSIIINTTGGTSPYRFSNNNGITFTSPLSSNTYAFTGLNSKQYNVVVKDSRDCVFSIPTITLTQPVEEFRLSIAKSQSITCPGGNNGSVELQVSGGTPDYQFSKDGSTWVSLVSPYRFDNLVFSGKPFSVRDSKGCVVSASNPVIQPEPIVLTPVISDVICKGDSTGNLSIALTGGTPSYTLLLTEPNGYSHSVSSVASAAEFSSLKAGIYTLTASDLKGCPKSETFEVKQPNDPLTLGLSFQNPKCNGDLNGTVELIASGGWRKYRYKLLPDGLPQSTGAFRGLGAGAYTFSVTDSLGCTTNTPKTLVDPTTLKLSTPAISKLKCKGDGTGAIEVHGVGGTPYYTYTLKGSRINQKVLSDGNFTNLPAASDYSILVTDNNGCTATTGLVEVTEPDSLKILISNRGNNGHTISCPGKMDTVWVKPVGGTSPFTLTPKAGPSVSYYSKGFALYDQPNGQFIFTITDDHGCSKADTAIISNLPGPKIKLISVGGATCSYSKDGRIEVEPLSVTGFVEVLWSSLGRKGNVLDKIPGGSYKAIATDLYGCTHDTTITVVKPNALAVNLLKKADPICFGNADGVLRVSASGGNIGKYTYLWSNGSQVDSTGLIPSGIYTVVVTDTKDCKDTATYTIIDPPSLRPHLPSQVTICSNQTYDADAGMPNATYLWFSPNGFTSSSRKVTLSSTGVYYLLVTNSKGCSGKDTLTLEKSSGIIDANFIMAEKASVGDTIVLIEMSWPVPQSIEWSYPASFSPIYHTDYSIYLVPQVVGSYSIGLTSFVAACTEHIEKVIIVEPSKGKGKGSVSKQPIIKGAMAYPNPNRGDFSVDVELNVEVDVMVEVYSVYGQKLLSKQGKGLTKYKVDINLFQAPGIYLVRISAGSEFRSLRVVVK